MIKKYRPFFLLGNLVILLLLFNFSVIKKERILKEGKLVLLELAPVDPRSLMQGDFMRLSYDISQKLENETIAKRGFCIIKSNENGVAEKIRLQNNLKPLGENEFAIKYNEGSWGINIGAESFFFQEGQAEKYDSSKYGGLRIDSKGNSILIGLYDGNFKKIE